jgi:hypothetical protein
MGVSHLRTGARQFKVGVSTTVEGVEGIGDGLRKGDLRASRALDADRLAGHHVGTQERLLPLGNEPHQAKSPPQASQGQAHRPAHHLDRRHVGRAELVRRESNRHRRGTQGRLPP